MSIKNISLIRDALNGKLQSLLAYIFVFFTFLLLQILFHLFSRYNIFQASKLLRKDLVDSAYIQHLFLVLRMPTYRELFSILSQRDLHSMAFSVG